MSIMRYALVALTAVFLAVTLAAAQPESKPASPKAAATGKDEGAAKKKELPSKGTAKEWHVARQQGFQVASYIVTALEGSDEKDFPGIAAWLKDYKAAVKEIDPKTDPATWPVVDVDALVTNNPHYWQAYYEVAPGDPGLGMLHGGLLYLGGEATRGSYVVMAFQQRPGVPQPIYRIMDTLVAHSQEASKQSTAAVMKGTKLYDEGKYDEALKLHEQALQLDPQNGFAHYEWGLTVRQRDWIKAGIKPPEGDKIAVNNKTLKFSAAVAAAFGLARRHDPFQWKAYQGEDPVVIESLQAMVRQGMPNWEKLTKARPNRLDDEPLLQLGEGCQGSRNDDLALVFRSVSIARRGRYAPEDHPFMAKSLRRLAPGKISEGIIDKLGGPAFPARQLISLEKP